MSDEFGFPSEPVTPPFSPPAKVKKSKWAVPSGGPFDYSSQAPVATPSEPPAGLITLPPLSKDTWAGLDGKAKWDSIVALRGPDLVGSGTLKWFTTAIIRHRLSDVMRVGGLVNPVLPFAVLPDKLRSRSFKDFDCLHFLSHVAEACDWLGISRATVESDLWFGQVVGERTHYLNAGMAFWKVLPDPFRSTLAWQFLSNYGKDLPKSEAAEKAHAEAVQVASKACADLDGGPHTCLG